MDYNEILNSDPQWQKIGSIAVDSDARYRLDVNVLTKDGVSIVATSDGWGQINYEVENGWAPPQEIFGSFREAARAARDWIISEGGECSLYIPDIDPLLVQMPRN